DSMLLPRVGWNVFTVNEEGDADAPAVMSRMFDAAHPPPYPLPENKTRTVFKTATTPGGGSFNEIRYEDTAGQEQMLVVASKDLDVLVQNAKTEDVKRDLSRDVKNDHTLDVGQNAEEGIVGSQTITIGGSEHEKVGKSRQKEIGKDETISIGGARSLRVSGAAETSAASRSLSVGVAQIDVSLGDLTLTTPVYAELVGGAVVRASPRPITEDVGMTLSTSMIVSRATGMLGVGGIGGAVVSAAARAIPAVSGGAGIVVQTIGGAKLELAGLSRTVSVTKKLTETVGGAMVVKTMGTFTDEATTKWSLTVGGKLDLGAKELVVEGDVVTLEVAGGTQIVVDKDHGVKISSASMDLSGAELSAEPKGKVKQN
ncbi:MAG TPA: hypothetical protein VHB21_13765, partial [Minicystis sp.]|nr:hypothetical protein [Minicystis sp.]